MSEGVTLRGGRPVRRWRGGTVEAVAGFGTQGAEVEIGQVGRDPVVFHGGGAADLGFLLANVAGVLDLELEVGGGLGPGRGIAGEVGDEVAGHAGAGEELEAAGGLAERGEFEVAQALIDGGCGRNAKVSKPSVGGIRPLALAVETAEPAVRGETYFVAEFGQAAVGAVVAEEQAVFGAGGVEAVGLGELAGD